MHLQAAPLSAEPPTALWQHTLLMLTLSKKSPSGWDKVFETLRLISGQLKHRGCWFA